MNKPCSTCIYRTSVMKHSWCERHFEDKCIKYQKYRKYLEKRKKYMAGGIVKTFDKLNKLKIVYFANSPKPMAFICNMPYRTVANLLCRGAFRHCKKKV